MDSYTQVTYWPSKLLRFISLRRKWNESWEIGCMFQEIKFMIWCVSDYRGFQTATTGRNKNIFNVLRIRTLKISENLYFFEFDFHMSVHRNIIPNYNQQDAPFIYFYRCCTCFRLFLRPSSGAHNCTYSFRYCQPILLLAAIVDEMELDGVPSHPR
jgi:hypothetical protein